MQIPAGSDAVTIKRKYKELAVALHPDKCKVGPPCLQRAETKVASGCNCSQFYVFMCSCPRYTMISRNSKGLWRCSVPVSTRKDSLLQLPIVGYRKYPHVRFTLSTPFFGRHCAYLCQQPSLRMCIAATMPKLTSLCIYSAYSSAHVCNVLG